MGRAPLGEMFIELGLDTTKFSKGTTQARNAVKFFGSEVRALDNVMKSSGKGVDALGAKHKALARQITAQKNLISQLYKEYNNPNITQGRRAVLAQQIANETAKLKAMEGQIKATHDEWKRFSEPKPLNLRLEEAGKKIDDLGQRIQKASKSFSNVGDTLTKGITAPIVAGAGIAIKAAMDYESAFAGVKKTVDGTAQDFEKLSSGIREMSKTMPASAVEIANVAEAAGQLGIKKEDILSFSKTMIDLGESTNLSATDAATAIAKLANITGMTADDYSRFGSAVVALGNNFATTEADIVNMSTRLASAGTMAGLTNQEILALATAMSSVGIEAEAGGTAMSQTLATIGKAVDTASEDVQKFATVAGMSAEEFTAAWKEKPMDALKAFISGLQEMDKQGFSSTAILEDLGMSGVRQSNMLKALGLAFGTVEKATKTANDAWQENTALSKEAGQRYETTESKMKMLKNQVTDLAIEFGGPLLDAIRDSLEAGKPFIKWASELAKKFSSLSKEQQQSILKFVGFAAAIGPFLSVVGRMGSGIGTLVSGFGKLTGVTGKAIGAFKGVGTAAEVASGASGLAGATTQTGLLSGAMSGLLTPMGAVAAIAAIAGGAALYFAREADNAQQRTLEWGAAVSQTQAGELQSFKEKVDESSRAISTFGHGGVEEVNNVRTAFQGLVDEISKLTDKELAKDLKLAEQLGFSQATIDEIKANAQSIKDNAQSMSDEVIQIYRNANEHRRTLSEEEKAIVLNNQNELINKQLELLNYSGKEKEAIIQAMNGKIEELNTNQLQKALDTTTKWIEDENKQYKKRKKNLEEMYESIKGTDEKALAAKKEIKQKLEDLEADHQAKMDAYGEKYARIQEALSKKMTFGNEQQRQAYFNQIEKQMDKLGLNYEQLQSKIEKFAETTSKTSSLVAVSMADMSEETRSANLAWNSMVLDPKTGKVKTNAKEEIQKAIEAEGGWDAMQFTLKHANLESNARIMVGEALVEMGRWDSLSPEEKALVVDGQAGLQAIIESKDHLAIWNSMPEEVKKILGDNSNFMESAEGARGALERWNHMSPTEQKLLAQDLTQLPVEEAQARISALIDNKTVNLEAKDDTQAGVDSATGTLDLLFNNPKKVPIEAENKTQHGVTLSQADIDKIKQTSPVQITAEPKVLPATSAAQAQIDSVGQTAPANITAVDATAGGTTPAQAAIDNVLQKRPSDIKAADQTRPQVSAAQSAIDSIKQKSPTQINAQDNASSVATGVLGILNSIPRTISVAINAVKNFVGLETGTDYHLGGPAIVNDQKGPLYKELIQLPNGKSFIPQGRNVLLDLPRGTKVLPAAKTRDLMKARGIPHYEKGVGFPDNSFIFREFKTSKPQQENDAVLQVLKQILFELKINRTNPETSQGAGNVYFDTEKVGRIIQERLDRNNRMRSRMKGEVNFE